MVNYLLLTAWRLYRCFGGLFPRDFMIKLPARCCRPRNRTILVFTPSNNGQFKLKDFNEHTRQRSRERRWIGWVWSSCLPHNISAFLWKIMQTRGIFLASRCRCCHEPHIETLCHIFIKSDVARAVWKCFGEIFGVPHWFTSILQAMTVWMAPVTEQSQYGACQLSVAAYIFREIWVELVAMLILTVRACVRERYVSR